MSKLKDGMRMRMKETGNLKNEFIALEGVIPICAAARRGNLEQVKKSLELCGYDLKVCNHVLRDAAGFGKVEIIEFLDNWDTGNVLAWHLAIVGLSKIGKFELVESLMKKRHVQPISDDITDGFYTLENEVSIKEAADVGNLSQIKKTLERCEYTFNVCDFVLARASRKGHVEIVEFLDCWDTENVLTWHRGIAGLILSENLVLIDKLIQKRKSSMNLETFIISLRLLASKVGNKVILEYFEKLELELMIQAEKKIEAKTKYICGSQFSESWN